MKTAYLFFWLSMGHLTAVAQEQSIELGRQFLEKRLKANPLTIGSLHINQHEFIAGDTLLFSAYFLSQAKQALPDKIILKAQVRSLDSTVTFGEFISVRNAATFGQLTLPDSIPEGRYQFELAYTGTDNNIIASRQFLIVKQFNISSFSEIKFYPEGGNLIEDVSNSVLIYSPAARQAINVVDHRGNKIAELTTDSLSRGVLEIVPQKNQQYFAVTQAGRFPLPKVLADGMSLKLQEANDGSSLKISCQVPASSKFRQETLHAYVVADGKVSYSRPLSFHQEPLIIDIPKRFLSPGLSQLIILDANFKVVAFRAIAGSDQDKPKLEIRLDQDKCYQRDSILVKVKITDEGNLPLSSRFSVSVINQNLFIDQNQRLTDNVAQIAEAPAGWLIADEEQNPQLNSQIRMRGQAVFADSGLPVPDSTIMFFYLQKNFMGYEAVAFDHGSFELIFLFDFFGADKLFFIAEHKGRQLKKVKVNWDDQAKNVMQANQKPQPKSTANQYARFMENKKVIESSYTFFDQQYDTQLRIDNPNKEFEDEFMEADVTIKVADYVLFPTMTDLVREVIPNLQHRLVKGEPVIRVIFSNKAIKPMDDPLYVIDGHMTKSTEYFLSLKPTDILNVKVTKDVYKLSSLGFLGKNGIVYVQLKKESASSRTLPQDGYSISGLIKPTERYWTTSQKFHERRPDLRSTLYWNPIMQTNGNGDGEFWIRSSDDVGKMRLRISGLTHSGLPYMVERDFEVYFNERK